MTDAATQPRATRPALFYVLAAFGLVAGAFGAQQAIATGTALLAPREALVRAVQTRNETFLKPLVPAADLERWSAREAETRYARRNAALPLAAVGLILSCLLFAGCVRAMRGDPWGISAWSMAASASVPYQLISTALSVATTRDLLRVFAEAPSSVMIMVAQLNMELLGAMVLGGLAVLYYGTCVIYLRTVRRRSSA